MTSLQKKIVANCQQIPEVPDTRTFKSILHITPKENIDSKDGKQTKRRELQSAVKDHRSLFYKHALFDNAFKSGNTQSEKMVQVVRFVSAGHLNQY